MKSSAFRNLFLVTFFIILRTEIFVNVLTFQKTCKSNKQGLKMAKIKF